MEGEFFSVESLRTVEVPAESSLLSTLVVVGNSSTDLSSCVAPYDISQWKFLFAEDCGTGFGRGEDLDVPTIDVDNRVITTLPLSPIRTELLEIGIREGNIHVVTDTVPPRHIACVQYLAGGTDALVHPKDLVALSLWVAAERAVPIQNTTDNCPVGGYPRLCGILTNAIDPLDSLTEAQIERGYIYVEEIIEGEGAPEEIQIRLPECQVDRGEGVFDAPHLLTEEFCQKINVIYAAEVLGISLSQLGVCGQEEVVATNPSADLVVTPDVLESDTAVGEGTETGETDFEVEETLTDGVLVSEPEDSTGAPLPTVTTPTTSILS